MRRIRRVILFNLVTASVLFSISTLIISFQVERDFKRVLKTLDDNIDIQNEINQSFSKSVDVQNKINHSIARRVSNVRGGRE